MAEVSASTNGGAEAETAWPPSVRDLVGRHKAVSLSVLVVLLLFVAIVVPEVLSAGTLKITDSTSCSAWSSARPSQQAAYVRLYLAAHRALPNGSTSRASIEHAVDYGCIQAYSFDEADSVTVLQAIKHEY
jgi:hypothetical protein